MSPDPWTAFLDWLNTILVPSWGELITLIPLVIVGTLVGPIFTLLLLMWAWHLLKRRKGRVQPAEAQPQLEAGSGDGREIFPPQAAYHDDPSNALAATTTKGPPPGGAAVA